MSNAVKLEDDVAERLDKYVEKTGIRKKFLASKAIDKELDQRENRLQGDRDN